MKKIMMIVILFSLFLMKLNFFKLERNEWNDEAISLLGLTIDGSPTTMFPNKESGYAIGSIICDKGANGVWDYQSWTLKIRNLVESRTKCQINFVSKYTENILNGTDPVLKDGLIPVTIDNNGTVKKANLGSKWYDYETKQWLNAVILNNEAFIT